MSPAKATLKDGRSIDFMPEIIGDGAMKQVYATPDRRSVVCFFKKPDADERTRSRVRRLDAILGKYNPHFAPIPRGGSRK